MSSSRLDREDYRGSNSDSGAEFGNDDGSSDGSSGVTCLAELNEDVFDDSDQSVNDDAPNLLAYLPQGKYFVPSMICFINSTDHDL